MLKDKEATLARVNSIIWNSCTPYEAAGWPPGMLDHIKVMMQDLAFNIIDSTYTEEELDSKVDDILFKKH